MWLQQICDIYDFIYDTISLGTSTVYAIYFKKTSTKIREIGIVIKELLELIYTHGERGTVVPLSRINDIKEEIQELAAGEFHTDWIKRIHEYLSDETDRFIPEDIGFVPKSVIIVVIRSPKVLWKLHLNGKPILCIVPPVYTKTADLNNRSFSYINDYLSPLGFSLVATGTLPAKMLAVHSGLGNYGRNNICYNKDFGSYLQIRTFLSDLASDEDSTWVPISQMENCKDCHLCVEACPTKAIDINRILIDSDRCITYHNEIPEVFPEWITKDMHNCVVGCIACQDCCPVNHHNKSNAETVVEFTESETKQLLETKDNENYEELLSIKIMESGLYPEYTKGSRILTRNLNALLKN